MQTQSALVREGITDDRIVPFTEMKGDTLALLHAQYVDATLAQSDIRAKPFEFKIPRSLLISELGRMLGHLQNLTIKG